MIEGFWACIYSILRYMMVNSSDSKGLETFQASSQNCPKRCFFVCDRHCHKANGHNLSNRKKEIIVTIAITRSLVLQRLLLIYAKD